MVTAVKNSSDPAAAQYISALLHEMKEDDARVAGELRDCAAEIAACEQRIVALRHKTTKLQRQQEQSRLRAKQLQSRRASLLLQLHMPPEVLSEIFWHCLPPKFIPTRYLPSRELFAPSQPGVAPHDEVLTNLRLCCSKWNSVVLSTPQLWKTFTKSSIVPADIPLLSRWLSRTGNLPLDLSIRTQIEQADIRNLGSNVLIPYLHRIKNLFLSFPIAFDDDATKIAFSKLAGVTFQRLEVLRLDIIRLPLRVDADHYPGGVICNVFESAARLKTVHLRDQDACLWDVRGIVLPWHQLTDLSCHVSVSEQILPILAQCTRLIRFSYLSTGYSEPLNMKGNLNIVTIPTLEILTLFSCDKEGSVWLDDFIRMLRLPSLKRLHILLDDTGDPDEDHVDLSSFIIGRCSCQLTLTSLAIDRITWVYDNDILGLLKQCPNISDLSLINDAPAEKVFLLLHEIKMKLILPRLQCLELHFETSWELDFDEEDHEQDRVPPTEYDLNFEKNHMLDEDDDDYEYYSRSHSLSMGTVLDMVETRWWSDDEQKYGMKERATSRLRVVRATTLDYSGRPEVSWGGYDQVKSWRKQGLEISFDAEKTWWFENIPEL